MPDEGQRPGATDPPTRSRHPGAVARRMARTVRARTHRSPAHSHHLEVVLLGGVGAKKATSCASVSGQAATAPRTASRSMLPARRHRGLAVREAPRREAADPPSLPRLSRAGAKLLEPVRIQRLHEAGLCVCVRLWRTLGHVPRRDDRVPPADLQAFVASRQAPAVLTLCSVLCSDLGRTTCGGASGPGRSTWEFRATRARTSRGASPSVQPPSTGWH